MSRLVELSRGEHSGLRIDPDLAQGAAARQHLIPIVVSEFRKAATQYPLVFAKNPDTGRFAAFAEPDSAAQARTELSWAGCSPRKIVNGW